MYTVTRQELLDVCRLVYDRELTNAAGSNFSGRASEKSIYLTATGNAKHTRLRMSPDDLLHVTLDGERLEGKGEFSISWETHRRMYREFDFVGAAIHAHPRQATLFACQPAPMPPLLDAMKKYGPIPVIPRNLKVDSVPFGDWIVEFFQRRGESFRKHGGAVFYPFHGILAVAPTFDDAYDLLERVEFNASAILGCRLMGWQVPEMSEYVMFKGDYE
jgi:L-fuculose-phosphate aldolase